MGFDLRVERQFSHAQLFRECLLRVDRAKGSSICASFAPFTIWEFFKARSG